MHVRFTEIKLRPGVMDDAVEHGRDMAPKLRRYKGFKQLSFVKTGDDTAIVLAFFETKEDADAAAADLQYFGQMGDMLLAPPERRSYEVPIHVLV